jgi:hypothetical protein
MTSKLFARFAMAAFAFGLAFAQEGPDIAPPPSAPPIPTSEDPPGRAARLSYITGTVSFQPGGVEDWVPASPNRPLTTGDRLWTETGSRAELTTGNASLRLNARTNFTFLNLSNNTTQIQIASGTLGIRVRRLDGNEVFEIDTPQAAFTILRPGDYRVDVSEQGDSTIATVRGGQAEAVATDNRVVPLGPRTQARIMVAADAAPVIDTRDAPVADNFDNFCQERDRREDRSESAHYVSREVPGYADLDDHGVWTENPQYGMVWAPRVDPGWAPYQTGHWAWIAPWGWTWVDDAPWGYAPFHYGRWAYTPAGWVWIPGPPAIRPVYAPALVAWVGGPHFGVGVAIGGGAAVGWFPLGPGEVWVPAYRASPAYFSRVNVSNTVIVNQVNITRVYNATYVNRTTVNNVTYVNQRVNGAVTAVPQSAMVSGRPVSQAAVRVPQEAAASGQVQREAAVAPQRAAVLGGRQAGATAPPSSLNSRTLMARATPPAAPVPFERQQSALQANPGQPVNRTAIRQLQPASNAGAIRQLNAPPARVSSPAPQTPAVRASVPQPRTGNGPPLGRSTETVAPRAAPSVQQPQTQSHVSTTPQATSREPERSRGEAKSKEKPKHEDKKESKKE